MDNVFGVKVVNGNGNVKGAPEDVGPLRQAISLQKDSIGYGFGQGSHVAKFHYHKCTI